MAGTLEDIFEEYDRLAQEAAQPAPRRAPRPPAPAVPPAPAPVKKSSFLDNMAGAVRGAVNAFQADPVGQTTEAMKGFNASLIRAPGQLIGGLVDTSADAGIFIGNNIEAGLVRAGVDKKEAAKWGYDQRVYGASLADRLSMRSTVGQYGNKLVNQGSTELLASAAPIVGRTSAAARLGAAALGGAVAMEAKPGDAASRAKNALVGAAAEGGGELVVRGVVAGARGAANAARALRTTIKQATPEEAAADALGRDFATQRTQDARDAARAAQAPQGAPRETERPSPQDSITEHPPGPSTAVRHTDTPQGPVTDKLALATDANAALSKAGAAERLDPATLEITPSGRIQVEPGTKATLDEAGLGRAFAAADNEADLGPVVILKEEAEDGSSRVVGRMGREDLNAFAADVSALRDDPSLINLPQGGEHGRWSMAHLGASYDAAAVLRGVVESIPGSERPVSDKVMMEAAQAAADAMGQSTEDALAFARSVAGEQGDAHVALKALQTIWTRMASDLDGLTHGVDWLTADPEVVERAGQAIHDLQMFSGAMEDAKTAAGRALRTLSLPDADTYLANLRRVTRDGVDLGAPVPANNPPPLPRSREELRDWLNMWRALKDNPSGQAAFLKGIRTYPSGSMYVRTAFANFFTGAILSAPKTILLNIVQAAVVGGLRTIERTAGAAMGSINPLLSSEERQTYAAIARQAPVSYLQTIGDVADAFRFAADTFARNESVLGGANPLDFASAGIPEPLIQAAQADGKSALPYHLGNLLNYLPRAVFRLHGTTNEAALHIAYMGEVRARALLEATTLKLPPEESAALVRQRLSEATDNADGSATDAEVFDSASRTTMIRQPDPEFQPGVAAFERTVQSWRKNVPELRYLLPVFQVPANGLGEAIRRIPGAGFLLRETSEELSGRLGEFRKAEAYGRMMLGGGFLAAGAMMARDGVITGAGPQDAADRALWLEDHQPYSFRLGGEWISYDRMDPVGPLLATAAGYYDSTVYRDTDRDMTLAAVGALAQYLKDKAALQGVSDLLNFGGDPRDQSSLMRRLGGVTRGFVPAFLQGVRVADDPDLRVKRSPWDYIVDALPGASSNLDPVRNLLGEPVHKPADTLIENLLPVTMAPIATQRAEPVLAELDRLYQQTGYTPGMLSPAAGAQAHFDLRDVKLEDGHSLYNALMKARTTSTLDGLTLKEALGDLIASPEYQEAPDGTGKVSDLEGGPKEDTRGGMIAKVFTAYTAQTKLDVANASPLANRWLAVAKMKADSNDVLRGRAAKDLVQNPALLDALGIDLGAYEAKVRGE